LLESLNSRFTDYYKPELKCAAFLDPRFKDLKFVADFSRATFYKDIMTHLKLERMRVKFAQRPTVESEQRPPEKRCKFDLFESTTTNSAASMEQVDFDREIQNYTNLECNQEQLKSHSYSPLMFYKSNSHEYPILSAIARKLFTIPCASVASEQLFSKSGQVITARRSSLKPKNAEALVLLSQNFYA
jgi:hypothetical protein